MEEEKEESKTTIAEGLGLTDRWAKINIIDIQDDIEHTDTVSEVMLRGAARIKEEELGKTLDGLSDYEKKLVYLGYQVCGEMMKLEAEKAKMAILGGFLSSIFKSGGEENNGEK